MDLLVVTFSFTWHNTNPVSGQTRANKIVFSFADSDGRYVGRIQSIIQCRQEDLQAAMGPQRSAEKGR